MNISELTFFHRWVTGHSTQWFFFQATRLHSELQYPSLAHQQHLSRTGNDVISVVLPHFGLAFKL